MNHRVLREYLLSRCEAATKELRQNDTTRVGHLYSEKYSHSYVYLYSLLKGLLSAIVIYVYRVCAEDGAVIAGHR